MGKILDFYIMPHPPIVVPEVGQGEEEKIQATYDACEKVADEIAKIKPDTIILITPHGPLFQDAVAISGGKHIKGDLGRFGAPQVKLDLGINNTLVEKIIKTSAQEGIPVVEITENSSNKYGVDYNLDHGSIVPLYFINKKYSNYKIIHITYGMLPKDQLYNVGKIIEKIVGVSATKTVFIASGDLSHRLANTGPYDYSPYGEKFDQQIISKLEAGDVKGIFNLDPTLVEEAGQCALGSFYIMLGAMDGYGIKGELLSYEGTFGVGYGVMKFLLSPYVKLAQESLAYYIAHGEYMEIPKGLPDEMIGAKRGVFVTLYKQGHLRGCIGTVFPRMQNVAQEIIRNAVSAGLQDPRFSPIGAKELEELDFSVDVLTKPEVVSKKDLDPKRYGVIVTSGSRLGLLLPDLEGVDTAEYQLSIAMEKGGILPDENYTIERFEVIRYTQGY